MPGLIWSTVMIGVVGAGTLLWARFSADAEGLAAGWARVMVEATRSAERRVTAFFILRKFQPRAAPGCAGRIHRRTVTCIYTSIEILTRETPDVVSKSPSSP